MKCNLTITKCNRFLYFLNFFHMKKDTFTFLWVLVSCLFII